MQKTTKDDQHSYELIAVSTSGILPLLTDVYKAVYIQYMHPVHETTAARRWISIYPNPCDDFERGVQALSAAIDDLRKRSALDLDGMLVRACGSLCFS